jgi:3-oxoacyl-[acyl-carrier protein] reductase
MTGQRVALTGGSRGIGFATAEQLARDGCAVVIADRNADAVAASVELLFATGTASDCRASALIPSTSALSLRTR